MAVTLTGTGGIFTRFGKIGKMANQIESHRAALDDRADELLDEYDGDNDSRSMAAPVLTGLEGFQTAAGTPLTILGRVMDTTLTAMVAADDPRIGGNTSVYAAILRDQMTDSMDAIAQNTVTSSIAAGGSNTGTGKLVVSIKNTDDLVLQYLRPEDIAVTCTVDSQLGQRTAGNEAFSAIGQPLVPNYDRHWPSGSGASANISVANGSVDASAGIGQNMLTNSDFETWTVTNTPDNWNVSGATVGTTLKRQSTPLRGTYSTEIAGNGSQLTKIYQPFDDSSGTSAYLRPSTRYIFGFWLRHDGSAPVAGVLRVGVRDGSNNAVGTPVAVTLSGITNSFVFYSGELVTPAILPSGLRFVVELTTALTSGRSIYIDEIVFQQPFQLGPTNGGPMLALFAGATDFKVGDLFTVTIANDRDNSTFSYHLDRFLDLYGKGIQFPYSGSPSIADSLLT